MIDFIKKIHQNIKEWVTSVLIKKILSPIMLILIYFIVLGVTSVIAKLFFRKYLKKENNKLDSNWNDYPPMSDEIFNTNSQS